MKTPSLKKADILRTFIAFIFASAVLFTSGCTTSADTPVADENTKPTVTVTTTFLEDMVSVLAKDYVNIQLIIPAGEDPHLYNPKPEDLDMLKNSDLVLYHGIHFEGKMVDVLENCGSCVTRNFKEGDIALFEEDGQQINDPHFWFDVALYKKAVEACAEDLEALVPDHKDEIDANKDAYLKELDELNESNKQKLAEIPESSRILVTPHDAFGYFARCYDLEVVAPQGVSTESEVANKDMQKTIDVICDNKVKAIFAESTTNPERMEKLKELCHDKGWDVAVVSGDGQELFSDSLAPKGEDGDTYITMYKHNIDLITDNLK